MTVARPPEVREYGFLPAGVYTQDEFARHLMDKPASYFYGVLWNKLYRRDLLVDHQIQFTSEVRWAEDLVFNMQYLEYANVLVSIPEAGYYYVQNPQSICHTQINAALSGAEQDPGVPLLHRAVHPAWHLRGGTAPAVQVPGGYCREHLPSGPFKEVIDEAKAYWKDAREDVQTAPPKRVSAGTACGRSCGKRRRNAVPSGRPGTTATPKNKQKQQTGSRRSLHAPARLPAFYAMFSGRVLSSRWRRTSWPATRAPRRSGGVPASRTPDGGSCSASPARPWSAHRHDGRGGDGHEHDRLKARKVPYWLSALCTHTSSFSMRMPTRSVSYTPGSSVTIIPGASGWCCGRSGRGGPSWTLPTKLTLWPVPQR